MDPILDAIDEALKRKGLSDAAASKLAVGNYALIKNMRSSRSAEKRYNVAALEKLAEVLDLEFYFGPPRDTAPVSEIEIDSERFAAIPRFEAELAAGPGRLNHDEEPVEHLAFNRTWLERLGLPPSQACLLQVKGESMLPELHDGDMVLIDRRKRQVRDRHVYAFVDLDGLARVKRLEVTPGERIILRSDNPEFQTEIRKGPDMDVIAQGIIGEVVWSGHTWS